MKKSSLGMYPSPEFDYDPNAMDEDVDSEWVRLMNERFGINEVENDDVSLKHLPGMHNQKLHGNRGGQVAANKYSRQGLAMLRAAGDVRNGMDEINKVAGGTARMVGAVNSIHALNELHQFFLKGQEANSEMGTARRIMAGPAKGSSRAQELANDNVRMAADSSSSATWHIDEAEKHYNRFKEHQYLVNSGKLKSTPEHKRAVDKIDKILTATMRKAGIRPKREEKPYEKFGLTQNFSHYFADNAVERMLPKLTRYMGKYGGKLMKFMFPYNPSLFKEYLSGVAQKHFPGMHNQKSHGYRGWRKDPLLRKYPDSTSAYIGARDKSGERGAGKLLDKWTEAVGKALPRVNGKYHNIPFKGKVVSSKKTGISPREETELTIKVDKPIDGRNEIKISTSSLMEWMSRGTMVIRLGNTPGESLSTGMNR